MKNSAVILASVALLLSSVAIGMAGVLFYLRSQNQLSTTVLASPTVENSATATPTSNAVEKTLQQLTEKFTALEASVSALQNVSNKTSKTTGTTTIVKKTTSPNDTSLFLGSGQTDNRDWITLTSAAADVDLRSYLNIKEIRFEAGLGIIGGEAHARLFDMTTGQPIYASEVYGNTDAGTWISSPALNLPAEKHNYAVQLKSTSGEMANLIGARLRIVTK